MKKTLLLALAAIPLFGFTVNFVYCDYDDPEDYWYDEYWDEGAWHGDYWVWYPHGYYCVHYVWWYPWWWDWYWHRCWWCHHFDWHFFGAGFYVVWYEDDCWWWRPRYGRWVRYKLPYAYHEFRYKAREHGISLPDKPPREINVPYKENEVMRLVKEKDPQLFDRVEKEHRTGNLDRMQKEYETKVKRDIATKNEEHRMKQDALKRDDTNLPYRDYERDVTDIRARRNIIEKNDTEQDETRPRIIKKERRAPDDEEDYKRSKDIDREIIEKDVRQNDTEQNNRTPNRDEKDKAPYIKKSSHNTKTPFDTDEQREKDFNSTKRVR